jgi:hypothetical protein
MIRVICVELFFGQSLLGHQDRQRKVAVVPASEDNGESCGKWTKSF